LPAQAGWQLVMHMPFWQNWSPKHCPQVPPQPSGPHCLPAQLGWHPHDPQPSDVTSATQVALQAMQQLMSIMHTHIITMTSSQPGRLLGTQQDAACARGGTAAATDNARQAIKMARLFPFIRTLLGGSVESHRTIIAV